jgi:hypothetical protein
MSTADLSSGEITVRNVLGQVVKTAYMAHGTARLSTREFDKGLYFISFGAETVKLLK